VRARTLPTLSLVDAALPHLATGSLDVGVLFDIQELYCSNPAL
jgi:hypothetical protein